MNRFFSLLVGAVGLLVTPAYALTTYREDSTFVALMVRGWVGALAVLGWFYAATPAIATCTDPPGDVNGDGASTVVDAQCALIEALRVLDGGQPEVSACVAGEDATLPDANCDNTTNVLDALIVILHALDTPLSSEIDGDGDGCHDHCTHGCCTPITGGEFPCLDEALRSCVCASDPFCCDVEWDIACIDEAQDCGECSGASCCIESLLPGCADVAMAACVCGVDSFCCEMQWDAACVALAEGACGLTCGSCGDGTCDLVAGESCAGCPDDCGPCEKCGDGTCGGSESCVSCPGDCGKCPGSCCEEHASPGCATVAIQECVCAEDAYCCTAAWDALCVTTSHLECGADCPGLCDGTPCEGSCCVANATPGCEMPAIQQCVCVHDSFCCDVEWDDICTGVAAEQCGVDCP